MSKRNSTYKIIVVALMAALVFVTTFFIKIEIPTPAGPTMLKVGNIVCLLSGLLFGGLYGGLAAGLGSMLFDLLNPAYVSSAPFTLVFFFLMGFICGTISHMGGRNGRSAKLNILGAACGALTYYVLYISKSIISLVIAGSEFVPALISCSMKMIVSGVNGVISVVAAVLLAPVLRKAIAKTGIFEKLK